MAGGISSQSHSGQAHDYRREGSELAESGWSGIGGKGVSGATLIAWTFEEERRFRRILKGCLAVRYAVCNPFAVSSRDLPFLSVLLEVRSIFWGGRGSKNKTSFIRVHIHFV